MIKQRAAEPKLAALAQLAELVELERRKKKRGSEQAAAAELCFWQEQIYRLLGLFFPRPRQRKKSRVVERSFDFQTNAE